MPHELRSVRSAITTSATNESRAAQGLPELVLVPPCFEHLDLGQRWTVRRRRTRRGLLPLPLRHRLCRLRPVDMRHRPALRPATTLAAALAALAAAADNL